MSENELLLSKLVPDILPIKNIYLDPNNPRFSIMEKKIPTNKIPTESIQNTTLEKMKVYNIDDLRDSIETIGFSPIDRIVVVKLDKKNEDKYVVIEGNRRIAAVKSLLMDINEGITTISNEVIKKSLENIHVLIIKDSYYDNSNNYQLLIQGVRHISGIKQWKPYQQARTLVTLTDDLHYSITDAASAIGLGRTTASWMKKAFRAFENMRDDKEVTLPKNNNELISYFSYFVEVIKSGTLREYFGWDNDNDLFSHRNNLLSLYKWIGLCPDISEEDEKRQIPKAIDIRRLPAILADKQAKILLDNGQNIELVSASLKNTSPSIISNYSQEILGIKDTLEKLPYKFIKTLSPDDKQILEKIVKICEEYIV